MGLKETLDMPQNLARGSWWIRRNGPWISLYNYLFEMGDPPQTRRTIWRTLQRVSHLLLLRTPLPSPPPPFFTCSASRASNCRVCTCNKKSKAKRNGRFLISRVFKRKIEVGRNCIHKCWIVEFSRTTTCFFKFYCPCDFKLHRYEEICAIACWTYILKGQYSNPARKFYQSKEIEEETRDIPVLLAVNYY